MADKKQKEHNITIKETLRGELVNYVNSLVNQIEEGNLTDIVDKHLSIETFKYGFDGDFKGAEILMAMNGPTVFIDTEWEKVISSYGSDSVERGYQDNIGLFDWTVRMASRLKR